MARRGGADAIVVAAGGSTRMGGTDKLLAMVGERPVLAHAIAAIATPRVASIVVVTSEARRRVLEDGGWASDDRMTFVEGGERRQDSVRAGFDALERVAPDATGRRVVVVHDGARPAVPRQIVEAVIDAADRYGAAIPVVPLGDTLKRLDGDRVAATLDRAALAAAQTPQGVRRGLLRDAFGSSVAVDGTWTDEAALLEACSIDVHVVPGDPTNLKVTMPADLARIEASIVGTRPERRGGIGRDSHAFGPGRPLRLGGVAIADAPALHGHSDGDVALHAIADGLLGAVGLGDLGRMFPAGPETPVGVDSRELLAAVVDRLADAGWRPASVDLTIVGARPRLVPHLDSMRTTIGELLGIATDGVSVKASTGNLDGADGAGRSMSALVLATVEATT